MSQHPRRPARPFGIACVVLAVAATLSPVGALADDVEEAIRDAQAAYRAGNLAEAAEMLDYASQLIRQQRGDSIGSLLPAPLDGWRADDADAQAVGSAMLGGATTASRRYERGNASVTVSIVTDSPMMQGVLMMMSNPMFATSGGGRLTRIGGQRAVVNYDGGDASGDVTLVVANRYMVKIEGRNVSQDDLMAYARAIDYDALENLA